MFTNKIKLITFDATNTLLKFCNPPWKHYVKVASQYGFKVSEEKIKKQFLIHYKILMKEHPNFGKETIQWVNWWTKVVSATFDNEIKDVDIRNKIANTLIEDYKTEKCWCLALGAKELLKNLKEQSICLGVISNFDPRLHEILSNVNLKSYFDFVITSYDIGYSKPDKRIFECAIKHTESVVSPNECLHIGDDLEKDYEGATAAGWQAILITENANNMNHVNKNNLFRNLKSFNDKMLSAKLFQ